MKDMNNDNMNAENDVDKDMNTDINADIVNESNDSEIEIVDKIENDNDNEMDYEADEPERKKESLSSKIKASFASKKFKGGAYATMISTIVIIMVLLVNIFATELDLKIDVSTEGLYTLTSESIDYIKGVEDDITIYYMVQPGNEDETFTSIIDKYANLSDHVSVVYKDPVLYPQFASQYVDDEITENSIIVVNNADNRAKYVDNADMYEYDIDYTTYQQNITAIDVEGQVTSAIQYVTTDDLPIMYMVQGHGEATISDTLANALAKVNVTTDTVLTLTTDKIPEDCSILLINAPQSDYTVDEVAMIKDYLAAGGDAIILADYNTNGFDNFNSLLNYYGVNIVEGIVLESDSNYYMGQYANNLVPDIDSHDITSDLKTNKTAVVVPTAAGIETLDSARSTITIEPLLTTSDTAFSKVNLKSETASKEDGDIDGPFSLGVAITETYEDNETKIVVYGSTQLIDESMLTYSSIGNLDLFVNSVNFISDNESTLSIPTKSVEQQYLTLTSAQVNFWSAVIVVIIPLLLLIVGGVICIRRRKK